LYGAVEPEKSRHRDSSADPGDNLARIVCARQFQNSIRDL
jgi:hypothetical protein